MMINMLATGSNVASEVGLGTLSWIRETESDRGSKIEVQIRLLRDHDRTQKVQGFIALDNTKNNTKNQSDYHRS
jgi:hypothetical protein